MGKYQCAICKGIYEKGLSDDEAEQEMKDVFGENVTVDDCGIVCDDCYNDMKYMWE